MKYFFVSDLHGCKPALLQFYLDAKGFNSYTDTLVVLGDIVDRGLYSRQILQYLSNMPHLIAVKGNHDVRTLDLVLGKDMPASYDKSNGVGATIASFLGLEPEDINPSQLYLYWQVMDADRHYNSDLGHNIALFAKYMRQAVWGVEFPDLIAVHGWVPIRKGQLVSPQEATTDEWIDATWANTQWLIERKLFPSKRLLIGHWHSWRLRKYFADHVEDIERWANQYSDAELREQIDFSAFEQPEYIAIDGCTNFSNIVNVYVYETDAEPILYGKRRE